MAGLDLESNFWFVRMDSLATDRRVGRVMLDLKRNSAPSDALWRLAVVGESAGSPLCGREVQRHEALEQPRAYLQYPQTELAHLVPAC